MNKLKIETTLQKDGTFLVTAEVVQSDTIPAAIFIHEVNNDGSLGEFISVAVKEELSSRNIWEPGELPTQMGSGFVRHDKAEKILESQVAVDLWTEVLVLDVYKLSYSMSTPETSTEIYDIE